MLMLIGLCKSADDATATLVVSFNKFHDTTRLVLSPTPPHNILVAGKSLKPVKGI